MPVALDLLPHHEENIKQWKLNVQLLRNASREWGVNGFVTKRYWETGREGGSLTKPSGNDSFFPQKILLYVITNYCTLRLSTEYHEYQK